MRKVLCACLPLFLLACRQEVPPPESLTPAELGVAEAPMWSDQGLSAQLRSNWHLQRIPEDMGFAPGTTPWRPAPMQPTGDLGNAAAASAATPGALLAMLTLRLGWSDALGEEVWEHTTRIWNQEEGKALGVILRWGLQDDAITGQDLQVHMRRGERGWYIERMEERFHCGRGVSDEGLCM